MRDAAASTAARPQGAAPGHPQEMIVDLFAGGGGASTGIHMATGRHPDVAVNHDPQAVALHAMNHPQTKHYCCDVFEIDPLEACSDEHGNVRPVGLLWASPDCTHHSKARGGKPASKKIRALAWVVVKWASALRKATGRGPRCIFLENVEEFQDWGPLDPDNRPDKGRRGEIFRLWVSQLEALGYRVEWRELVAADYGAPTTRKRLALIARCDGRPIVWPEATHAPRKALANPGLFDTPMEPWRAAAEIIDWNLPCPSIFGRKKPLAPKTQARIAKGIRRFVVEAAEPFIVPVINGTWNPERSWTAEEPLRTVTASKGGDYALVNATLAGGGIVPVTHAGERPVHDLAEPARTITSANRGELGLVGATLVPRYGEAPGQEPRALDVAAPYPTVVPTGNGGDLASVSLAPLLVGSAYGDDRPGAGLRAWPADDAARTVTSSSGGGFNLAAAHLTKFSENSIGTDPADPLHTAMAGAPRHGLVAAHLTKFRTGSSGADVEAPMPTVTANSFVKRPGCGIPLGLVAAHLGRQFGTAVGRAMDDPHPTVMTDGAGGKSYVSAACLTSYYGNETLTGISNPVPTVVTKDRHAPVVAYMEQANTGMVGRDAREPMSTIVAGGGETSGWGTTQRAVQADLEPVDGEPGSSRPRVVAFLRKHFGDPTAEERADPAGTVMARLRHGLVKIGAAIWQIADIGMRMLTPRELYGAQGFPQSYIIDRTAEGPLTKTAQTRMAGNSVSPPWAAAIIRANDPLRAGEGLRAAAS